VGQSENWIEKAVKKDFRDQVIQTSVPELKAFFLRIEEIRNQMN
jgi:hypothetical protein